MRPSSCHSYAHPPAQPECGQHISCADCQCCIHANRGCHANIHPNSIYTHSSKHLYSRTYTHPYSDLRPSHSHSGCKDSYITGSNMITSLPVLISNRALLMIIRMGCAPKRLKLCRFLYCRKSRRGQTGQSEGGRGTTFIDALNNNDRKKIELPEIRCYGIVQYGWFSPVGKPDDGWEYHQIGCNPGRWGRVQTMDYGSPPNAAEVNYVTRPDLVHKFVVVGWRRSTKTTILVNPPKGDLYWPLVTKHPVWIPMDRLEAFPILPLVVTADSDLYIQTTPGPAIEKTAFQLSRWGVCEGDRLSAIRVWRRNCMRQIPCMTSDADWRRPRQV